MRMRTVSGSQRIRSKRRAWWTGTCAVSGQVPPHLNLPKSTGQAQIQGVDRLPCARPDLSGPRTGDFKRPPGAQRGMQSVFILHGIAITI